MKWISRTQFSLTFLLLFLPLLVRAQQDFGEVSFANSGPAAAQVEFLKGLAQLHNFEYDDAAEHFREARQADPDFAMAYWGEAMTKNHAVWHEEDVPAAREVLNRLAPTPGGRLAKAPTEREKLYLHSIDLLYGDGTKEQRDRQYESALYNLHSKFPDDVDATAFLALAILGTAEQGRDFATYMRAAAVLEEVFPQHPRHPGVVHYLIHCYDDPVHAPLGLRAAHIYSKVAPEAGHAQHMTSHIFLALGMWDDEVKANEIATATVNRHRNNAGKPPKMCGHYNEWLAYGYSQQGHVTDARRVLEGCRKEAEGESAIANSKDAAHATMKTMLSSTMTIASYAEMRAHFLIDNQLWDDPVTHWTLSGADNPIAELTFDYVDTLVAFHRGDVAAVRAGASRSESDRQRLKAWMEQQKMNDAAMSADALVRTEQLPALVAAAEGKTSEAIQELQRIATEEHQLPFEFGPPVIFKPTDELLGELLLQMDRPSEAQSAFQSALARTPGRRLVVNGLMHADQKIAVAAPNEPATRPAAKP